MKVEIDVDELCSLRADLRALMVENEKLKEKMRRQKDLGTEFVSLLNKRKQEAAQLVRGWATMI